jgi:hypothetical protein
MTAAHVVAEAELHRRFAIAGPSNDPEDARMGGDRWLDRDIAILFCNVSNVTLGTVSESVVFWNVSEGRVVQQKRADRRDFRPVNIGCGGGI